MSSPREIDKEWRFVVVDGKVVTGCQYKDGARLDYQPHYDDQAYELATSVASVDYEPDPVWVMDICKTSDGNYHLLEIGGFSFADLYACDMKTVVSAVSAAAQSVWEKANT